jgi:hypothetical protein
VNSEPKQSKWQLPRLLLIFVLLVAATCILPYWFIELRPQYVEVDAPDLAGLFGGSPSIWGSLDWGTSGRAFVWRNEWLCPIAACGDPKTLSENWSEHIENLGWEAITSQSSNSDEIYDSGICSLPLPETQFLSEIDDFYYVRFAPQSRPTNTFCDVADLCVLVWQEDDYLHTAVGSYNPSTLSVYASCMG